MCARCEKYVPHVPRSNPRAEHSRGTQISLQLCPIQAKQGTDVPLFQLIQVLL